MCTHSIIRTNPAGATDAYDRLQDDELTNLASGRAHRQATPDPAPSTSPSSVSSPLSQRRSTVQSTALKASAAAFRTTHTSSSHAYSLAPGAALDFDGHDEYEMVQQYGAAQGHGHEDRAVQQQHADDPRNSSEGDALLGDAASARKPKREGHASLTSSTSNLANTIIGSGEHNAS